MNNIITGAGFHHIALRANDFEASIKFYNALGFNVVTQWGEGDGRIAMLDMGDGTIIELFAGGKDEPADGRFFHLAIKADDIEAAYNTAINAGATTKIAPKIAPIDSKPEPMTLHIAFVFGPSGEVLEFFKIV